MSNGGSDFVDDIVPSERPQHLAMAVLLRKDFAPWQRVRKQFIREEQWNHEITFLVKRYLRPRLQTEERPWSTSDIEPSGESAEQIPEEIRVPLALNCLVIPGDDLLDVRSLWQALDREQCYLRFLGFNNRMDTEERRQRVHVAENAVKALPRVCGDSLVAPDSFQSIARNTAKAFHYLRKYGPYEVVNLDLCDSLLPHPDEAELQNYCTALHQLLIYQFREQTTPWLLFLTTQIDPATANQAGMDKLAKPTRENCNQHTEFSQRLTELVPEAAFKGNEKIFNLSVLNEEQLVRVFGVVLGKLLVWLGARSQPHWTVKMLSSYRYTIEPVTGAAMLSLGFLFRPHFAAPLDPTGLSTIQPEERAVPSELHSALTLVESAKQIRDPDVLLQNDTELRTRLTTTSADLLAAAGYDRETYLSWVADGERETRA